MPTNHIRDLIIDNDTIVGLGMAYADSSFSQQGLLVVKFDSAGNFITSNLILDSLGDHLSIDKHWGKIINTPEGGYAMTTATFNRTSTLLVKANNDLEVEFVKEYADTINLSNFRYVIENAPGGGYLLYGSIQRPNFKNNPFVRRVDSHGNTIWFNYYGDYDKTASIVDLKVINDSTIIAAVVEDSGPSTSHSRLVSIDLDGNVKLSWSSGPQPEIGYLRKVIPIAAGGGYITYGVYVTEITINGTKMVQSTIAKLSADFELLWVEHFGNVYPLASNLIFWDIEQTLDGYFIGAGQSVIEKTTTSDFSTGWLLKFTEYGDILWERKDMGPYPENYINSHYFGGVGVLSSGNIVAGGTATKGWDKYIWLVKVTNDGCMDTILCEPITGIVERAQKEKEVMKFYPNPASKSVTVELPSALEAVEISIYDLQGRAVSRQIFDEMPIRVELPTGHLPTGIYILKAHGPNGTLGQGKLAILNGP
ncbi:MAG: T9SS type A sorting domain-containing protein [Saprospiraceae bacterium]